MGEVMHMGVVCTHKKVTCSHHNINILVRYDLGFTFLAKRQRLPKWPDTGQFFPLPSTMDLQGISFPQLPLYFPFTKHQLRAKRPLSQFNNVLLRTRRVLSLYKIYGPTRNKKYIKTSTFFSIYILSVESQKGISTIQQCSIENQKGSIAVQSLWPYMEYLPQFSHSFPYIYKLGARRALSTML